MIINNFSSLNCSVLSTHIHKCIHILMLQLKAILRKQALAGLRPASGLTKNLFICKESNSGFNFRVA